MFVFFFSSRRRHTRFDCDWSSDVCSSDLETPAYGLWTSVVSAPLIESTFMNHAIAAPQAFSRVQNEMLVGASAPTRTPIPSLPLSPGTYVASSESRSEEHTSELQSQSNLVCRLLLEKKKK